MKIRRYRMDFDRLKSALEKRGYRIYLETESILEAVNFPFHFWFTQKRNYTHIYVHLDKKKLTGGHTRSGSPGNKRRMQRELNSILRIYNMEKFI